jgi:O-antigen ligase
MDRQADTMQSDSLSLKSPANHKAPVMKVLLIALAIALSIVAGSIAQGLELRYLAMALLFVGLWGFYALFFGITLHSTLPFIGLFFIKPHEISFYLTMSLLVLLGLIELIRRGELKLLLPYPLAFCVLLCFGIYSSTKINIPMGYSYFFSSIIVPLLALCLFRNATIKPNTMYLWMQVIVGVAAFVGLYGVVIAIRNPLSRLGSFWVTAMTINGFYTVAFFFAVALALHHKVKWKQAFNALAALAIFFGMIYTYTRMAILAVAFGMFLFMLKLKVMRYFGLGFLLLLPLVIPSSMVSRIQMGFSYDVSLVIRALAWYLSVQQIIAHPFTGMGFSVWSTWYPKVIPLHILYAQHSHNVYLNLMVEMGIIGTAAYFYIVWSVLCRFWKNCVKNSTNILSYGMWVAMMALLFACITDIFIQQYSVSILFWISLGLMLAYSNPAQFEPKRLA